MLSLRQALDAIAPAYAPSERFSKPCIRIGGGEIVAWNGTLAARAPFSASFPEGTFVLDAADFSKAYREGAAVTHANGRLVIKLRKTKYSLQPLGPDSFAPPDIRGGGEQLTRSAVEAVCLASKFASDNAIYAWACGVTLHEGRAIATNNIAVVSVECPCAFEGTLPFWAVATLRRDAPAPMIRGDEFSIAFTYPDGVTFQSGTLAAPMPPKLFDLIADLSEGTVPTAPLLAALDDAFALGGKHCKLDLASGSVIVDTEGGASSETELEVPAAPGCSPIVLQEKMAKLILSESTHLGLDLAPYKIIFSRDAAPRFLGLAAALV